MLRLILAVLVICFAVNAAQAQGEVTVYLKDGSVVRGAIIEKVPGQFVKIRLLDNRVLTYKANQIMEIIRQPIIVSTAPRKNPLLAGCLSGCFPGLGQFYNGESGKGAIQMGAASAGLLILSTGLSIGASMTAVEAVEVWDDWGTDSTEAPENTMGGVPENIMGVGFALYLGALVWSVIDAPSSAREINDQNERQRRARLIEFHDMEVNPIASRNALGARFAFRF